MTGMAAYDERAAHESIEKRFQARTPSADQAGRCERFRDAARELALFAAELSPVCRERSTALTKIEEAVMWFDAAVARNE